MDDTYLEGAKELIVADGAVTVTIEVSYQLLCFLLSQIETVIDEAPSKIFHIQLAVSIVVHSFEDSCNSFDTSR